MLGRWVQLNKLAIMGLKEFLFGKKREIYDERIGKLTTRVKNENPSINYTWSSEHQLFGQAKPTVFIMEGNVNGPAKNQLNSIYNIIDTLDEIIEHIIQATKTTIKIKENFYLTAVLSSNYETKRNEKEFEINFEPINEDSKQYISLMWNNGNLTEIEIN